MTFVIVDAMRRSSARFRCIGGHCRFAAVRDVQSHYHLAPRVLSVSKRVANDWLEEGREPCSTTRHVTWPQSVNVDRATSSSHCRASSCTASPMARQSLSVHAGSDVLNAMLNEVRGIRSTLRRDVDVIRVALSAHKLMNVAKSDELRAELMSIKNATSTALGAVKSGIKDELVDAKESNVPSRRAFEPNAKVYR